ncbi:MAG: DNA repair protein RadC [Gilvibacter sp.]
MKDVRPTLPVSQWDIADRPREKLLQLGKRNLSSTELLAIILGSGSRELSVVALAQKVLSAYNNDLQSLSNASVTDLKKFKGIGTAKAVAIVATMQLAVRTGVTKLPEKVKISSSKNAFLCMEPILSNLTHEEFWVLHLNNANNVIYKQHLSKGGYTATLVDVRIILKEALSQGAISIILVHNHPSGVLKPSQADITMTKKITKAAASIDIKVLDHLIVGHNDYYSFADNQDL